ncbi:MAG: DMT family transporter [Pseudomonadota bacterium]
MLLVVLALIAFAANSVLTRLALVETTIDPITFTAARLASGAMVLVLIVWLRPNPPSAPTFRPWGFLLRWVAPAALLGYAILFTLAYRQLTAATGALLLFGAVQLSMLLWTVLRGERLFGLAWCGVMLALAGLVGLLLPGLQRPPLASALMMVGAGIAWAVYTLQGRLQNDPTRATAINFVLAAIPISLFALLRWVEASWDGYGLTLAVLSGAVASGLGYVIWYAALPHLKTSTAAVAQLQVPVITALAGVLLLAEPLTIRLIMAGGVILGGIILVIAPWQGKTARP